MSDVRAHLAAAAGGRRRPAGQARPRLDRGGPHSPAGLSDAPRLPPPPRRATHVPPGRLPPAGSAAESGLPAQWTTGPPSPESDGYPAMLGPAVHPNISAGGEGRGPGLRPHGVGPAPRPAGGWPRTSPYWPSPRLAAGSLIVMVVLSCAATRVTSSSGKPLVPAVAGQEQALCPRITARLEFGRTGVTNVTSRRQHRTLRTQ